MDPLSALSLTANIFQVIGFSIETVRISLHIHESGTLATISDLERASANSQKAAKTLATSASGNGQLSDALEQDLSEMTQEALHITSELDSLLRKLHGNRFDKSRSSTALKTFRVVWNKDKVLKLQQRLHGIRDELQFHVIVSIRARMGEQSLRLDDALQSLDNNARAILTPIVGSLSTLEGQSDAILTRQAQSEASARERHDELLTTINGLSLTAHGQSELPMEGPPETPSDVDIDRRKKEVQSAIMSSLWFPSMQDREDAIPEAHKATYRWIYREPIVSSRKWDHFGQFLWSGSGVYWVTGKPGSGKSTLMKFINTNPETNAALKIWARGRKLLSARFYFYYNGSTLEKSELGVLRSLIHQLCWSDPELIQIGFADRFEAMCLRSQPPSPFTPTLWELKRVLKAIVDQKSKDLCFFFMVDGLDEYDADSTEMAMLANVLMTLSGLEHVKSVLSSRPLQVFEHAFGECPRLRLHELTLPDITALVESKISRHPGLRRLARESPADSEALVQEIVDASSGVFLWVQLVINSLTEGFQNHDRIDDLQRRLRDLPTDLEYLYRHMWDRIPPYYRPQASRLLQLVATATRGGGSISVLGLSLAEEQNEELVFSCPTAPHTAEEIDSRHEDVRAWISSRCMGLVEINGSDHILSGLPGRMSDLNYFCEETSKYKDTHVAFIHRTVSEFIAIPDIRDDLYAITQYFSPEQSLCRSAIHLVKRGSFKSNGSRGMPAALGYGACNILVTARVAEDTTKKSQTRLLLEFDNVMVRHARTYFPAHLGHWSDLMGRSRLDKASEEATAENCNNFLSLAVRFGLIFFVQDQIQFATPSSGHHSGSGSILQKSGRPLLDYALRPDAVDRIFWYLNPESRVTHLSTPYPDLIELLLSHGCDPDQVFQGKTLWKWYVTILQEFTNRDDDWPLFVEVAPAILGSLLRSVRPENRNVYLRRSTTVVDLLYLIANRANRLPNTRIEPLRFRAEMQQICELIRAGEQTTTVTQRAKHTTVPALAGAGAGAAKQTRKSPFQYIKGLLMGRNPVGS
ncbi:hypothetical protein B0H63DRAFT_475148 [Podospora didyma]|uniref:NACHT domain-containing protein n=1 Tax=Podospora didyma TaxID=330526 RepID=A0AAE0NGZ3_9PEZI|nr:hypothetical protein B0H63DRAFT_475148 [Podospora didyma]